jgi:hypothetical protein
MSKNSFMPSKIIKLLIALISLVVFSFLFSQNSLALENSFVNIVNPVRGRDFWGLKEQEPLTAVKEQLKVIQENNFAATWLLRPDAIFDSQIVDYFKSFPANQELGLFLEVTPTWATQAKVDYHQDVLWHYANSVFLSGYTLEERKRLIDAAFKEFKNIFGNYPQSVGAWHIDAKSLEYMEKKYAITGALICADQFLTDNYQIWGGWWGVPYYPSRFNVLIPAQSKRNKLQVVIFQWAARDPLNGYGSGVQESTFSVQANDYLQHHLTTDYFSKLIDVYLNPSMGKFGQVTVGLENDNPWSIVGKEYENQIKILASKKIKAVTMSAFATWYQKEIPGLSPQHQISSEDLLGFTLRVHPEGSGKKAIWLMSTNGRLGILTDKDQKIIRDWRAYNEKWAEPYLEVANQNHQLQLSLPAKIDTVRFPDKIQSLNENPENLIQPKINLPFQTPVVVFLLMIAIFLTFLIISFKLNKWFGLLMFLGVGTQALTMIKSGLLYSFGMGFWGPNGHDGVWHLALINELTKHFPPQNPVFAQFKLLNYHWLFDLLVALINKITLIPTLNLYFQIFPIIFSGFLGILIYLFVKKWTKNNLASLLAVFFAYFGGSFGWIVTLLRGQGIGGESMFWANQSVSFLINPPFALSLILILAGFYLYLNYLIKPTKKLLVILSLLLGLVVGVKAYGGIILLFGLGLASFWEWLMTKKLITGKVFLGSLLVSLVIFLPSNLRAPSLFVFSPLWFPRTMLAFPDRFGWQRLDQARQAYLATGKWLKWLLAEGLALTIFFVGNLGTRIIGVTKFFSWLKSGKKIDSFQILFLGCLLVSGIIPLLFIQKGNPWNTIQFFYYFLFLAGILAAWWLGEFFQRLPKRSLYHILIYNILLVLLVGLTIPTTLGTLKHYLPSRAPARIGFEELEALEFLKNRPEGVVLTYPHDYKAREITKAPKPLYAYETTAYVSAFSHKETFLEDEMNLEIMGVDWRPRRSLEEQFFTTHDEEWARNFLRENNIKYVYLTNDQKFEVGDYQIGLEKIFENGEVRIYEFRGKIRLD